MINEVGQKVEVKFYPYRGKIVRVLMEDAAGLYICWKGQRVEVRPVLYSSGKPMPGRYLGQHPDH